VKKGTFSEVVALQQTKVLTQPHSVFEIVSGLYGSLVFGSRKRSLLLNREPEKNEDRPERDFDFLEDCGFPIQTSLFRLSVAIAVRSGGG